MSGGPDAQSSGKAGWRCWLAPDSGRCRRGPLPMAAASCRSAARPGRCSPSWPLPRRGRQPRPPGGAAVVPPPGGAGAGLAAAGDPSAAGGAAAGRRHRAPRHPRPPGAAAPSASGWTCEEVLRRLAGRSLRAVPARRRAARASSTRPTPRSTSGWPRERDRLRGQARARVADAAGRACGAGGGAARGPAADGDRPRRTRAPGGRSCAPMPRAASEAWRCRPTNAAGPPWPSDAGAARRPRRSA